MRIHTSDRLIAWLTLFSGLTISAVAIYYSVAGLTAIFAAAVIPIIVMGVALEISKLAATVWLKQNWSRAPNFIRGYLLAAILILMLITSMGIFGFLSKAHSDQSLVSGDVQSKLALVDEKIKIERDNIANAQQVIKQMDAAVNGVISTGDQEVKLKDGSTKVNSAAERSLQIRRQQAKDRAVLTKQIEEAQSRIVKLQEESAPIRAEVRKVEAEVGPIKYIANFIYGDNPDANVLEKAVTWVIIIIVVVFDPLAVILLLASQYSFMWFRQQQDEEAPKSINDFVKQPTEYIPDPNEEMGSDVYEFENPPEKKTSTDPHPIGWMYPKHASIQEYRVEDADEEVPVLENEETWSQRVIDEEPSEEQDESIMSEAPVNEKTAMHLWKQENPDNSLKHQKNLFKKGVIKELPWKKYLTENTSPEIEEAKKWAEEHPGTEEAKLAEDWAKEQESVSWMETDDQGNQIKKIKDTYQQNAEQSERTIWQRIQDSKK